MADREQFEQAFRLAREDLAKGIGDMFGPRADQANDDAFTLGPPFTGDIEADDEAVVAVPWQYTCEHSGDFQGLFPTGKELTIRGVTFVDRTNDKEPIFHRYVDWADVMTQLGFTVSRRVLVDEEEYKAGLNTIRARYGD